MNNYTEEIGQYNTATPKGSEKRVAVAICADCRILTDHYFQPAFFKDFLELHNVKKKKVITFNFHFRRVFVDKNAYF